MIAGQAIAHSVTAPPSLPTLQEPLHGFALNERQVVPPMPEGALREALVNAVIHRDYAITASRILLEVFDDRIVVTSPGALPKHMTVEQARMGGAPRSWRRPTFRAAESRSKRKKTI